MPQQLQLATKKGAVPTALPLFCHVSGIRPLAGKRQGDPLQPRLVDAVEDDRASLGRSFEISLEQFLDQLHHNLRPAKAGVNLNFRS